jgi:hypothetical protein
VIVSSMRRTSGYVVFNVGPCIKATGRECRAFMRRKPSHTLAPTAKPALPVEGNLSAAQYLKVCRESVKADKADSGRDGSIPAGRDSKTFPNPVAAIVAWRYCCGASHLGWNWK